MKVSEYANYDGLGLAELIRQKEVTVKEVGEAHLTAVSQINPHINAIIESYAERVESLTQDSPVEGQFGGVPFLLKDLFMNEAGCKSESGSRLSRGMKANSDSFLTQQFKNAGLMLMGRTTTPEFGLSGSTESILTGATRNPWDLSKMAGGSSGGAAAAVSSGIVPMAHASDGAGSIRIPASCCNLVGLKTSRGRTSTAPDPEHPYSFSVNFVVSRTVRDTAVLLDTVHGAAPGDFTVINLPSRPYAEELNATPRPLRIAVTTDPWGPAPTDPEVAAVVQNVAKQCEQLGHHVIEASPKYDYDSFLEAMLVMWGFGIDHYFDWLAAETNQQVGPDTLEPVTLSYYKFAKTLGSKQFVDATAVLNQVNRDTGHFFETVDLLLTPSLSLLPQDIGRYAQSRNMNFHDFFRLCDESMAYYPLFNMTGQPAISLPLGLSQTGLPIGVQFAARFGDESTLIQIASQLEQALPWHNRKPNIFAS